ncbi:4'-phosphopantetheinyl transferase family protein [Vogesella mureinivorans]|jgi:phosphopantetheinyl transferase|uniref:4'-phosphopantetheinyl transferase family protein n=1 Tax=Vogesella mureinivorans TaxID=657276 RepID=UPI0011CC3123|nr:4'-phosphopantetheinyl transferase superfamily protein [Vogesella mureinivorans]
MNTLILLDRLPALPDDTQAQREALKSLGRQLALQAASQLMSLPLRHFAMDSDKPPCLLLEGAPAPLGLSISHSGPWVAAAVSVCRPLGLDLEQTTAPAPAALGELLAADESAWLAAQPVITLPGEPFWAVWTLKEALGKYHGRRWETPAETRHIHQLDHYAAHLALPEQGLLLAISAPTPLDCKLQYAGQPAQRVSLQRWPGYQGQS